MQEKCLRSRVNKHSLPFRTNHTTDRKLKTNKTILKIKSFPCFVNFTRWGTEEQCAFTYDFQ